MKTKLLQLAAVVSTALYLVATGAHLFELPRKMALSPADYMMMQQIYTGWQWFGVAIGIALLSTAAHTLLVRTDRQACALSLAALIGLAATQAVFWAFTYPVNIATHFWTAFPEPFETARQQWEYSHAASALLTLAALIAMTMSALVHNQTGKGSSASPA